MWLGVKKHIGTLSVCHRKLNELLGQFKGHSTQEPIYTITRVPPHPPPTSGPLILLLEADRGETFFNFVAHFV